jgi:hypothetical protein
VAEKTVQVRCYSGFKGDERPTELFLGDSFQPIVEIEDRWYSPGESFFRVRLQDDDRYVLRHVEAQDIWTIEGYRSGWPHVR